MSKYVVTGGAGFIGSAIVRGLLRKGAGKVIVIDNLLSGPKRIWRRSAHRSSFSAPTSATTTRSRR